MALAVVGSAAQEVLVERTGVGRRGMVVSVNTEASDVGLDVLKKGGNAVDAAVATALALAVTHPPAGNIGGGGFMVVLPPGGKAVCFDYRETAPAAATREMFAKGGDRHGALVVGVPGTLRGLELAHRRFGKLKWSELVEPAVKLAREGFAVDADLAASLNRTVAGAQRFAELVRVYAPPSGKAWREGDLLKQPDLASTLALVARDGPNAFYEGQIAEQLVAEMKASGGLITLDDLRSYRAKERTPIHGTFRGYDLYAPPPPSSGGIALAEMLNILEHFPLRAQGRHSPATLHAIIEAMRRAYRDRAAHLGDPDHATTPAIPASRLISKDYAAGLAKGIDPKRATPSAELAGEIVLAGEGDSTTHFSVIDAEGMAVSNTYTLEDSYGSRVVVRGAGFLLNNEMGDFNWRPGHTDREGKIGTLPNQIAPGKRMLSSMTPTIVAKDGRPVLITGSPGGRTIINTVLLSVLDTIEFDLDIAAASATPRLHHQWFPDLVKLERRAGQPTDETLAALRALGHRVEVIEEQGHVCALRILPDGRYQGAADPRKYAGKASAW